MSSGIAKTIFLARCHSSPVYYLSFFAPIPHSCDSLSTWLFALFQFFVCLFALDGSVFAAISQISFSFWSIFYVSPDNRRFSCMCGNFHNNLLFFLDALFEESSWKRTIWWRNGKWMEQINGFEKKMSCGTFWWRRRKPEYAGYTFFKEA